MGLDIAPSLAKVRVDGSNPFARSRFIKENKMVKGGSRVAFLLPWPRRDWRGSVGEAAESVEPGSFGGIRHSRVDIRRSPQCAVGRTGSCRSVD